MDFRNIKNLFQIFRKRRFRYFSLIEVLIVLSIIVILSGFILASYQDSQRLARDKRRIAELAAYQNALHQYYSQHKVYPIVNNACVPGTGACLNKLKDEGFLDPLPQDPLSDSDEHRYWYAVNATGDSRTTGQDYKIYVVLETDEQTMRRDGGTCPGSPTCPGGDENFLAYEIYSTLGSHMMISYPGMGATQLMTCDIVTPDECEIERGVKVLGVAGKVEASLPINPNFLGGAHSQKSEYPWLEGWEYRKPIIVDNSGNPGLTNYTISIDTTDAIYHESSSIGSWHFSEGSGIPTADMSGNNNTGVLHDGPTWVNGKFGKALSFDGNNDHIDLEDSIPESSAYTLEGWIRTTATSPNTDIAQRIITIYYQGQGSSRIGLGLRNNQAYFFWRTSGGGWDKIADGPIINDGQWHYIVGTTDGISFELFVDGVSITSKQSTFTSIDSTSADRIGCFNSNSGFFNGIIDEVKVHSRVLGPSVINTRFNALKGRLDYADIRVTDEGGTDADVLVDYWQESDKKLRVIIDSIAANEVKTIYLYYGNLSANALSLPRPIIFADGFESGNYSAWDAQSVGRGTLSFPSFPSSDPYEGDYNARFVSDDINWAGWGRVRKNIPDAYQELYVRGYHKFDSLPSGNYQYYEFSLMNAMPGWDWATAQAQLRKESDTFFWRVGLKDDSGTRHYEVSSPLSPPPQLDRWYCIELYARVGSDPVDPAPYGQAILWVDGSQVASVSGVDTDGWSHLNRAWAGAYKNDQPATRTFNFDNFVVSDSRIGCDPTGPQPIVRLMHSEQSFYDDYCLCCFGPPDLGADCDADNAHRIMTVSKGTDAHVQQVAGLLNYWYYRVPIKIDNTAGTTTYTDHPINLTIDTNDLISDGKMQGAPDPCADIRFAAPDGLTEIDFWFDPTTCNTDATNVWVEVPLIPASATTTIYLYYGNDTVSSDSNLDNVCPAGLHPMPSAAPPAYKTPIGCSASSEFSSMWNCNEAIDGSIDVFGGNCWFTQWLDPPQWIYFDLGEEKYISGIRTMIFFPDVPMTFDIQVSDDASGWTTVVNDYTINVGDVWETIPFPETTGRYIRLYQTAFPRRLGQCTEFQALVRDLTGPFCTEFYDDFDGDFPLETGIDPQWTVTSYEDQINKYGWYLGQCPDQSDPDPLGGRYWRLAGGELTIHSSSDDDGYVGTGMWPCGFAFSTDVANPIEVDNFKVEIEGSFDNLDSESGMNHVLTPILTDGQGDIWALGYYIYRDEDLHWRHYINSSFESVDIIDVASESIKWEYINVGNKATLTSITGNPETTETVTEEIRRLEGPIGLRLASYASAGDYPYFERNEISYYSHWDAVLVRKYAYPSPIAAIGVEHKTMTSDNFICLSAAPVRDITCEYRQEICYPDETTICSMSDYTNAHIGAKDKSEYPYRLCCRISL